jgi:hypothetical protein
MTFGKIALSIIIKTDIQHYDTQYNLEHSYADCWLCSVSVMLSVTIKPYILCHYAECRYISVVMLGVVALHIYSAFSVRVRLGAYL